MAAIIGGIVAAVVGGAIWAGIAIATDFEIGYVAIGIGALAGFAVAALGKNGSASLGMIAGACALLGLLAGKIMIFSWGVPGVMVNEIRNNPELRNAACYVYLEQQKRFDADLMEKVNALPEDEDLPEDLQLQVQEQFTTLQSNMTEADNDSAINSFVDIVMAEIPMSERIQSQLSLWDVLWGALAIGAAWKIANGSEGTA